MEIGTVKFFNAAKGFGFIKNENGKDIFVHINGLSGISSLQEGQKVNFDTREGKKGLEAYNVTLGE